jgi:hypothetical protein
MGGWVWVYTMKMCGLEGCACLQATSPPRLCSFKQHCWSSPTGCCLMLGVFVHLGSSYIALPWWAGQVGQHFLVVVWVSASC